MSAIGPSRPNGVIGRDDAVGGGPVHAMEGTVEARDGSPRRWGDHDHIAVLGENLQQGLRLGPTDIEGDPPLVGMV